MASESRVNHLSIQYAMLTCFLLRANMFAILFVIIDASILSQVVISVTKEQRQE